MEIKDKEIVYVKEQSERDSQNYEIKLSAIRLRLTETEKKIYEQVEKEYESLVKDKDE